MDGLCANTVHNILCKGLEHCELQYPLSVPETVPMDTTWNVLLLEGQFILAHIIKKKL